MRGVYRDASSSHMKEIPGKQTIVTLIRESLAEQLEAIRKSSKIPSSLATYQETGCETTKFGAIVGPLTVMFFTSMTSSNATAVVVGQNLSETSAVMRETCDLWLQQ